MLIDRDFRGWDFGVFMVSRDIPEKKMLHIQIILTHSVAMGFLQDFGSKTYVIKNRAFPRSNRDVHLPLGQPPRS